MSFLVIASPPVGREHEPAASSNSITSAKTLHSRPPACALGFAAPNLIPWYAHVLLVMHFSCHRAFATRGPVMTDNGAPRIDAYVAFVYMLLSKIGVTNKVRKMSVLVTSKSKGAKKITFCCNIQEYNAPAFSIHGSCSLNLRT